MHLAAFVKIVVMPVPSTFLYKLITYTYIVIMRESPMQQQRQHAIPLCPSMQTGLSIIVWSSYAQVTARDDWEEDDSDSYKINDRNVVHVFFPQRYSSWPSSDPDLCVSPSCIIPAPEAEALFSASKCISRWVERRSFVVFPPTGEE